MELTSEVKALLLNTAKDLKGSALRMFMARTVQVLGEGGQRLAERELGWNRGTIFKGMREVEHGMVCVDAFSWHGRKRSKEHLPHLLVEAHLPQELGDARLGARVDQASASGGRPLLRVRNRRGADADGRHGEREPAQHERAPPPSAVSSHVLVNRPFRKSRCQAPLTV